MPLAGDTRRMSDPFFATLRDQPADGLLALMLADRPDPRPGKLDLGIGVDRDETGNTPVMAAVKAAERVTARSVSLAATPPLTMPS